MTYYYSMKLIGDFFQIGSKMERSTQKESKFEGLGRTTPHFNLLPQDHEVISLIHWQADKW